MALARSRKFLSALLVIYELVYPVGKKRTLLLTLRRRRNRHHELHRQFGRE